MASAAPDIHPLRRRLLSWGRENRRSFPWRDTTDPWQILLAEVLLQRSRGATVAKVHQALLRRWPTPAAMARARVTTIERLIRPVGLTSRASRLRELAAVVAERGMPRTVEGLLELPGVGPYAANATASVAFGVHAPVVDAVSARVYRRYWGLGSELPPAEDRALWTIAERSTPRRNSREWNWAVLDLAAAICVPKLPRCHECPLRSTCAFPTARTDVRPG